MWGQQGHEPERPTAPLRSLFGSRPASRAAPGYALYRKLERELYRAYHQKDRIDKADHFFNFCVTAQAMRDYFFERTGKITRADQQSFDDS